MKMPHSDQAQVPAQKITHYLLSDSHPIGKAKAKFFKSFGFDEPDIFIFEKALLTHATERDVVKETPTDYGTKYELRCTLPSPDARNPCIISVWMVKDNKPRLVTAYPG